MTTETVRLHITPFAPDFASAVLGSSFAAHATNISYHSIETFPENSFGFVDLPAMEAEKLKKKLNGSLLKGKKMRVESARTSQRTKIEPEALQATPTTEVTAGDEAAVTSQKRKNSEQTLTAYELPGDRKVKRGWTEPRRKERKKRSSSEKEAPSSKYSDKQECLFRTKVPQNKAVVKALPDEKKKKKQLKEDGPTIVHEFQKSTKYPTFLRSGKVEGISSSVAEFVDDKGWVDSEGIIVEPASKSKPRAEIPGIQALRKRKLKVPEENIEDTTEKSSGSLSDISSPALSYQSEEPVITQLPEDEPTSSSGSDPSTSDDSDSEADSLSDAANSGRDEEDVTQVSDQSNPKPEIAPHKAEPHPLEALFKRPAPIRSKSGLSQSSDRSTARPSLEISTGFSFFGENDEDSQDAVPPLTPFSSQDRQWRGMRSAAPTPDTAAPSRTSFFPGGSQPEAASDDNEDDGGDYTTVRAETLPSNKLSADESEGAQDEDLPATPTLSRTTVTLVEGEKPEQSEFVKWFYEHRGENNRLWKRRRREAAKEKRQAENRKRARNSSRRQRG